MPDVNIWPLHAYIHTHMCTCKPLRMNTCISHMYTLHIWTWIHTYTYTHMHAYPHLNICTHVCMLHTWTHTSPVTHTYKYAYTNTFIPLHVNTYATQMCACIFLDAKIHIHKLAYHTYVHAHPYMWTHIQTCIWIYLYMPHVDTHVYVHSHMWVYIYACIPHTHTWEKKSLWFFRCFLLSQIWA